MRSERQQFPFVMPIDGELLRFHVRSRTDSRVTYMIDLSSFDGNGVCSCDDFQFRKQPRLRAGAEPSDSLRCWHLRQARNYLLDVEVLPKLAARINGNGKHHTREQRAALREGT